MATKKKKIKRSKPSKYLEFLDGYKIFYRKDGSALIVPKIRHRVIK